MDWSVCKGWPAIARVLTILCLATYLSLPSAAKLTGPGTIDELFALSDTVISARIVTRELKIIDDTQCGMRYTVEVEAVFKSNSLIGVGDTAHFGRLDGLVPSGSYVLFLSRHPEANAVYEEFLSDPSMNISGNRDQDMAIIECDDLAQIPMFLEAWRIADGTDILIRQPGLREIPETVQVRAHGEEFALDKDDLFSYLASLGDASR